MKKYICSVCGYVYDEAVGDSDREIEPGTKWKDVSKDWNCPLCGAVKVDFEEEEIDPKPEAQRISDFENEMDTLETLSFGGISALCSNLSKGCEKQYRFEEAELFKQLAEFYNEKRSTLEEGQLKDISTLINQDLDSGYVQGNLIATEASDRGALRALVWGEKVTKILKFILTRYAKQKEELLESTHIYICDICGFVYIGDDVPEICPVCKVPNKKIIEVKRG